MTENIRIISYDNATGSVSLKHGDSLKLRLKLTLSEPLAQTDVLKVMLSSSSTALTEPLYCGIAETCGVDCVLKKAFDDGSDYSMIDTVEIIVKNVFTEEVKPFLKVCFNDDIRISEEDSAYSEYQKFRQQLDALQNNSAYKAFLSLSEDIKSPVERAADALAAFKAMSSADTDTGAGKAYMKRICDIAEEFDKIALPLLSEFIWYKITDADAFIFSSAIEHIISYPETYAQIKRFGYYMLGIKKSADTVCIAVPADENAAELMANVSDCTVYIKAPSAGIEYCCVGVIFAPDGQYFTSVC